MKETHARGGSEGANDTLAFDDATCCEYVAFSHMTAPLTHDGRWTGPLGSLVGPVVHVTICLVDNLFADDSVVSIELLQRTEDPLLDQVFHCSSEINPHQNGVLTADDTESSTLLTWRVADEEQVSTASLEVVESLETVDVGPGLGKGQQRELRNGPLIVGAVGNKLLVSGSSSTVPPDSRA